MRHKFLLPLAALAALGASAQVTSADINDLILVPGSVVPVWHTADNPNYQLDAEAGCLYFTGDNAARISFTYTSDEPVSVSMRHEAVNSTRLLNFFIDDAQECAFSYDLNWYDADPTLTVWFPAGTHTLTLGKGNLTYQEEGDTQFNLAQLPISSLELRKLSALGESGLGQYNTIPISWTNDESAPWREFEGYLTFPADNQTASQLKGTFNTTGYASVSFEMSVPGYSNQYDKHTLLRAWIDGEEVKRATSGSSVRFNLVVAPGNHEIVFRGESDYSSNHAASLYSYPSRVRVADINIEGVYTDIAVGRPGQFGALLLQHYEYLDEVRCLKVSGELNESDLSVISSCLNLQMLDAGAAAGWTAVAPKFFQSRDLKWIAMPEGMTEIGDQAFDGCQISSAIFPQTLASIGYMAFNRTKFREVTLPESLAAVGTYAFQDCDSLRYLHLPSGLEEIPGSFAKGCPNLRRIELPASVRTIGNYAFYGADQCVRKETQLEIPASVTSIGDYAFEKCGLWGEVAIPENCGIGKYSFYRNSLTSVSLPTSMKEIPESAFRDNPVTSIKCAAATPPVWGILAFDSSVSGGVEVPEFANLAYKTHPSWRNLPRIRATREMATRDYWAIHGDVVVEDVFRLYGRPRLNQQTASAFTLYGSEPQYFTKYIWHNGRYSDNAQNNYYRGALPSSFINDAAPVEADELSMRYYVKGGKWHFISLPADVAYDAITPTGEGTQFAVRRYDGARRAEQNTASGNWVNVLPGETLRKGEGYIIQTSADAWVYMDVAQENTIQFFEQPDYTVTLAENACENSVNAGWNYIGNPYPSYFDIAAIDIAAPITVFDGRNYVALSLTDDELALCPMEGFFVQAPEMGNVLTMHRAGRQATSEIQHRSQAPAAGQGARRLIDLTLAAQGEETAADRTRVVVNDEASLDYERSRDAAKFMAESQDVPQLYTIDGAGSRLAINERPYADGSVSLGMSALEAGRVYTLAARRLDCRAWIHDAATGAEYELSEECPFTFIAAGTADDSRFTLRLAAAETGIGSAAAIGETVEALRGAVRIRGAEGTRYAVYTMQGALVGQGRLAAGTLTVEAPAGPVAVTLGDNVYKAVVR